MSSFWWLCGRYRTIPWMVSAMKVQNQIASEFNAKGFKKRTQDATASKHSKKENMRERPTRDQSYQSLALKLVSTSSWYINIP